MLRFLLRAAAAAVALTFAQVAAGALTISLFGAAALPKAVAGSLPWQLLANALVALVLAWIAQNSATGRWRLASALGVVYLGVMHVNSLIEAWFFGFVGPAAFGTLLLLTILITAFLVAALAALVGGHPARQAGQQHVTATRFAQGALAYLVVYFVAGLAIYPYISHYYDLLAVPPVWQVIAMQLFIRGPIFVALAALVVHVGGAAGRLEKTALVGVTLSVIGGVAPLIVPNALMPDSIRWFHFVEVTVSNFVYGAFLGWLLTRAPSHRAAPREQGLAMPHGSSSA